jgi:hypothetical protein
MTTFILVFFFFLPICGGRERERDIIKQGKTESNEKRKELKKV